MYAEDASDITKGALVMAIAPQSGAELESLSDMIDRGAKVVVIGTADQLKVARDALGESAQIGLFRNCRPSRCNSKLAWVSIYSLKI